MRLKLQLLVLVLGVLLVVLAFATTVWPTRWRYDRITYSGDTYPVRINRFSGHADILLPGDGWTPAEEASPPGDESDEVPGRSTS